MKQLIYSISFVIIISGCSKTHEVKRDLNGTYSISEISVDYFERGNNCQNTNGDFNLYKIAEPGKIKFTGKKPIQGSSHSKTNKTYIGYFDFEYNITDADGVQRMQDEPLIFQYEFPLHSIGDYDTVQINIIDNNNYLADLILEKEGDKIVAFKYQIFKNDCYIGFKTFKVE